MTTTTASEPPDGGGGDGGGGGASSGNDLRAHGCGNTKLAALPDDGTGDGAEQAGRRPVETSDAQEDSGVDQALKHDTANAAGDRNDPSSVDNLPHSTSNDQQTNTAQRTRKLKAKNAWTQERVNKLKSTLSGLPTASSETTAAAAETTSPDMTGHDAEYRSAYDCARRLYRLRTDGHQREMTALEERTLYLWLSKKIYLATPPGFTTETHVGAERDVLWQLQRSHLRFRLYAQLPVGFILPDVSTTWHFCHSMLSANASEEGKSRVKALVNAAHTIVCSAKSQMVELTFVKPGERDFWANKQFNIGRGAFTLKATDALAAGDPADGYDDAAVALLYQVHVFGRGDLDAATVRAWISAATGVTILTVAAKEPSGANRFDPHTWEVTFNSTECPPEVLRIRRLRVASAGKQSLAYLHHPRAAYRFPCKSCLSVDHYRKECANSNPEAAAAKYSLDVETEAVTPLPFIIAAKETELRNMMKTLRERLAPEVAERHRAEKKRRKLAKTQLKAKTLAEAAVAAAKLRNTEVQLKQAAEARRRQREVAARSKTKAAVTAELNGLRSTSRNRRIATPSRAAADVNCPQPPPTSTEAEVEEDSATPATECNAEHMDSSMASNVSLLDWKMRLGDLGDGAVTPPPGEASVPLPFELAAAIAHELNKSTGSEIDSAGVESGDEMKVPPPSREAVPAPGGVGVDFAPPSGAQLSCPALTDSVLAARNDAATMQRARQDHSATLARTLPRKTPAAAAIQAKPAAPQYPKRSESHDDGEVKVLYSKEPAYKPQSLSAWINELKLQRLSNKSAGHCLFYAIRAAAEASRLLDLPEGSADDQTTWVKAQVLCTLSHHLAIECERRTMDLSQLFRKYVGTVLPANMEKKAACDATQAAIELAAGIPASDTLPLHLWGSSDEVRMAALWLHTTIYVLDARSDTEAHVIRFEPESYGTNSDHQSRTVLEHPLQPGAARRELRPALWSGRAILLVRSGDGSSA
ncbi:hypothetical protein Gpo141_00013910, partial [Globisporangium polare]